jgi:hypothetical protein
MLSHNGQFDRRTATDTETPLCLRDEHVLCSQAPPVLRLNDYGPLPPYVDNVRAVNVMCKGTALAFPRRRLQVAARDAWRRDFNNFGLVLCRRRHMVISSNLTCQSPVSVLDNVTIMVGLSHTLRVLFNQPPRYALSPFPRNVVARVKLRAKARRRDLRALHLQSSHIDVIGAEFVAGHQESGTAGLNFFNDCAMCMGADSMQHVVDTLWKRAELVTRANANPEDSSA